MVPFAKYEFSGSYKLTQSMQINSTNNTSPQTYGIMKILRPALLNQIIDVCHNSAIYQFLTTAILISIEDPTDSDLAETALLRLLK